MLLYDLECSKCGVLEDEFRKIEEREICPACAGPCRVLISPTRTVGIVWSNQEHSSQLGRTFHTNKEKRDWLKAHPNARPMAKGDSDDRKLQDSIRNQADQTMARLGHGDLDGYQANQRKAKKAKLDKPAGK